MDALNEKIAHILQPILYEHECELIEFQVCGHPKSRLVKIYADKPGGISIHTCTRIARQLRDRIDADIDALDYGNYRIEVSSPGIDRPLKTLNDFKRHIGRVINFKLIDSANPEILGELIKVENDILEIRNKGTVISLPFEEIKTGKIQIQWKS